MILFLDFDGVLHPARAVMGQHGPELAGDGSLFMWAAPLAELLAERPHVQIVLSTSWARHLPFEQVRDFLPVALRRRVVGSTWHRIQTDPNFSRGLPFSYWQDATRYQQVKRWVNVHRLRRWVAVDDDAKGWDEPERLVQTNPETGLSDPAVVDRLSDLLDLHLSEQRLIDARAGRSRTHTLDEVERDLGLAGCGGVEQMVLVIDLEATCCDQGTIPPEQMEVIELGAVWATPQGEVIDTLQRFVRPTERPTLTPFCIELTHIQQAQIDTAPCWPTVAAELAEFARLHAGQCWGSWGAYDRRQIERESARHGLADPLAGLPHVNLKATFAKARKIKQVGMATALQIVGLELGGEHHRALSDARNIARLLPWALG